MSTAADRIKANAERFRTQALPVKQAQAATAAPPAEASPPAVSAIRQRSVRRTVDLAPTQHRALDMWQREAADRLGLARVTGQDVLSALVDQLVTDPELSAQITHAIQARQ
ncbi:MAG: hypothetical protein JOZ49_08735 [Mycolicibacterium sp.]|jgi:hypothetical protein|nr:hypothetical protein [Mycolicibacterium sp.]